MNSRQKAKVMAIMEKAADEAYAVVPMADHDMLLVEWSFTRAGKETGAAILSFAMPEKVVKALGGKVKGAKLMKQALLEKVKDGGGLGSPFAPTTNIGKPIPSSGI